MSPQRATYAAAMLARSSLTLATLVALATPALADVGPRAPCPPGTHAAYLMGHRCVREGYHLFVVPGGGVVEVRNGDPDPTPPVPSSDANAPPSPAPAPTPPPAPTPAPAPTPPPSAPVTTQPPAVPQPGPRGCAVSALGARETSQLALALGVATLAAFALRRKR